MFLGKKVIFNGITPQTGLMTEIGYASILNLYISLLFINNFTTSWRDARKVFKRTLHTRAIWTRFSPWSPWTFIVVRRMDNFSRTVHKLTRSSFLIYLTELRPRYKLNDFVTPERVTSVFMYNLFNCFFCNLSNDTFWVCQIRKRVKCNVNTSFILERYRFNTIGFLLLYVITVDLSKSLSSVYGYFSYFPLKNQL